MQCSTCHGGKDYLKDPTPSLLSSIISQKESCDLGKIIDTAISKDCRMQGVI